LGQRSLPGEDGADRRQKAKAANDAPDSDGGDDMFTRAGVAAE
jgi:ribonucleoside-diphosphate reductase beta chain